MAHLANVHFINYCTYCAKRAFFLDTFIALEKRRLIPLYCYFTRASENTEDPLVRKQLAEKHARLVLHRLSASETKKADDPHKRWGRGDDEPPSLRGCVAVVLPPEVVSSCPWSPVSRSLPRGRCVCMTPCTCARHVPDGGGRALSSRVNRL